MEKENGGLFGVISGKVPLKTQVQLAVSPEIVFLVIIILLTFLYVKFKK